MRCYVCAAVVLATGLGAQQHNLSSADIENGARIYNANCFACHGPNGNQVAGVDLRRGTFRHAVSDDDLAKVVLNGIPGTAMPPNRLNPQELQNVVAYIRSLKDAQSGAVRLGEPQRGQILVEGKGACLSCHRINGKGSYTAVDLSEEGAVRNPALLESALLDPKTATQPKDRMVRAVTRQGETISGRRLNEDTDTVQIIDTHERLRSLSKADLREYSIRSDSAMPSYKDKLSSEEISDVVAYLTGLKGGAIR